MFVPLLFQISFREQTVFLICEQSLWAACGRVIVNEIVARRRCIMGEPTTSPEQRDGELRSALEQIQSLMAVPALRCGLMSSSLALSIMLRATHVSILGRLLPRASATRMRRNLMVTSLLDFPPHLGNPHVSVSLKCIYMPGRPCTSRHVLKSTLTVSLPHRSCIVLSGILLLYHVSLLTDSRRLVRSGRLGHTMLSSSGACGCVAKVR